MTQLGLDYLKYHETKRSNLATERETNRSNLAREEETHRSNLVDETERNRHNIATETETNRSNLAKEAETNRANLAKEGIDRDKLSLDREKLDETIRANQAKEQIDRDKINETIRSNMASEGAKISQLAQDLRIAYDKLAAEDRKNMAALMKSNNWTFQTLADELLTYYERGVDAPRWSKALGTILNNVTGGLLDNTIGMNIFN